MQRAHLAQARSFKGRHIFFAGQRRAAQKDFVGHGQRKIKFHTGCFHPTTSGPQASRFYANRPPILPTANCLRPSGGVAFGSKVLVVMPHLARLLHLTDSALPTGAFAYSYGLESSITFGLLKTETAFRAYLYSFLQQAVGFELPFITDATTAGDNDLPTLLTEYDAQLLLPALHRASLTQGKNWLKLLNTFYPEAGLAQLNRELARQQLPVHFVPLFGLSLGRAKFSVADIQAAYLHLALRDQLSAAIRLGFIGPMAGHLLQHDFYGIFETLLDSANIRPYTEAARCTLLLDVAQILHDDIYSRLFQN